MTDQQQAPGAHISAASEERFIASTEEFAAESSRATVIASMTIQALLVACVVLWVLDVPRQVFGMSFYTEQLLAVTLGLTLALAFITEATRKADAFDLGGAITALTIAVYLVYHYQHDGVVAWPAVAGLAAALAWTFAANRMSVARGLDWVCASVSLALCAYITVRYEALTYELAMLPFEGVLGSAILTFLVLEASRRISGWGFVAIILAIAVYVYISPFSPGDFQTRWVSPERMVAYVGLDVNGMIGSILQVAVLVVIPYTILGQVLARTGGADFFSDLAMSAMWRFRGGAAKIAVVGSALFGMISGSAVSNVLAVGVVTIPAMKKSGFSAYRAAAIESVGSTGGQLMPPVMGAAAFIMAEFLQVSYGAVCIAAAIPAVLYYACLFIHVDLEAAKHGIGGVDSEEMAPLSTIIKSGWHFLVPIFFLVIALIYPEVLLLTPEKAAVASTALLIVLTLIFGYRGKRTSIREITVAIIESGRVSLDIILIGAAAGIMVGVMSISGLAFSMTLQLLALSGDNVFLLLLLIAVLAFVLGIGLPTVSVYILTATLLAPALVKLGVTPMAAHMFVMYNGMLSMITPPVAFAAYAAANIARTDGWTTGWIACLVGWSTFILPFLFVLTPSLLMDGPTYLIVWNFVRILFALFVGTAAIVGFALTPLTTAMRFVYGGLALPIALPPESFSGSVGYTINFIGIGAGIALLVFDHLRRRRNVTTTAAPA
ncbi:TRAP transporter permease [Rhodoplanes sp. Z2-YC6860]|uniref:TRAP transporter permease n=1 Tax=Rhodoplanes sp. Z2-YC6860 TaxID=674703 RepID=UPI00078CD7C2|nr:TRAP transporter fused permease subunit [Rhodoplanes sp. Z2-YC6860]AMN40881.1 TRAP transporter, 4TM/12TM fusion protein [Rhodoplanes sp. Z2-YC6860]